MDYRESGELFVNAHLFGGYSCGQSRFIEELTTSSNAIQRAPPKLGFLIPVRRRTMFPCKYYRQPRCRIATARRPRALGFHRLT